MEFIFSLDSSSLLGSCTQTTSHSAQERQIFNMKDLLQMADEEVVVGVLVAELCQVMVCSAS